MKEFGDTIYNLNLKNEYLDDDEDSEFIEFTRDRWLDEHELGNIESHIRRYFSLLPPLVSLDNEISEKIKELYAETRRCFVYGQFRASIALSRSVIEVSLKERKNFDVYDRTWTAGKCLREFKDKDLITQDLHDIGKGIVVRADNILHRGAGISEEEALYFLDKVKIYIELFYK